MFGWGGFSASKLKPQLKMAVNRINIASNKKSALMKQNMREVAILLAEQPPKEEKARIRAEALIRDDNLIEAYEILQLECEMLSERIKLIECSKTCPPDMLSCVSTLIYAANRVDIPELTEIRKQLRAKFGKKFEEGAMRNANGVLNERVVSKLSVHPPAAYLVQTYLERICEQFEVDWKPTIVLSERQMIEPMAAPVGYSVQTAQGTGLGSTIPGQQQIEVSYQESPSKASEYDLPPVVVSAKSIPSEVSAVSNIPPPAPGTTSKGIPPPIVTGTPFPPTKSLQNGDDLVEPDIYIPQIPSARPRGIDSPSTPQQEIGSPPTPSLVIPPPAPSAPVVDGDNKGKKDDNNDEDNQNDGAGTSANDEGGEAGNDSYVASYEDLAARFDALSK